MVHYLEGICQRGDSRQGEFSLRPQPPGSHLLPGPCPHAFVDPRLLISQVFPRLGDLPTVVLFHEGWGLGEQ